MEQARRRRAIPGRPAGPGLQTAPLSKFGANGGFSARFCKGCRHCRTSRCGANRSEARSEPRIINPSIRFVAIKNEMTADFATV
jgi:hypothetical protein